MWKDQDLHKLFRSRLPIADLPQAFAERLTYTILQEVAVLRQTNPARHEARADQLSESTPFKPAAKPTPPLSLKCTLP